MGKQFLWQKAKDQWLLKKRGISFEDVLEGIANNLLDVRENTSKHHGDQMVFIINFNNYPWVVPFKETEKAIILLTAFPDRRLTKEFGFEKE
ncbi:MAG: toxin [Bacteriovoracaceae bacterium]|nr:toxin [Bacteriovoracaceae bacterium]